jgi:uncharacterized protein
LDFIVEAAAEDKPAGIFRGYRGSLNSQLSKCLISQSCYELAIYALYTYTRLMTATFDPKKDAENLKKHGVSLSEGDGVLSDPLALTIEDDSAEEEQCLVTLGANTFGSLMVVVWTPRDEDVRIISVRKPTPKERRNYEEGV